MRYGMKDSVYMSSNFAPKVLILDIEKVAHAGAVDVSHVQNLQNKCEINVFSPWSDHPHLKGRRT